MSQDISWIEDETSFQAYYVTLAFGIEPIELLSRMDCDVENLRSMTRNEALECMTGAGRQYFSSDSPDLALAGHHSGWSFTLEEITGRGADRIEEISRATKAVSHFRSFHQIYGFEYAEDGDLACAFEPGSSRTRGSRPDMFLGQMERFGLREIGIDGKVAQRRALAMSSTMFGLTLPRAVLFDSKLLTAEVK